MTSWLRFTVEYSKDSLRLETRRTLFFNEKDSQTATYKNSSMVKHGGGRIMLRFFVLFKV